MPVGRAFGVGLCQVLALVPGVSRSGATIVGGLALGLERTTAAEFSFFLSMPTMTAAFAHDLIEVRHVLAPERFLQIGGRIRRRVPGRAGRGPAVPAFRRAAPASPRSPGTGSSPERRSWRRSAPAGCRHQDAVAAPQFHHRVLRHRAAHRQRGGAGVGFRFVDGFATPIATRVLAGRCPASACW